MNSRVITTLRLVSGHKGIYFLSFFFFILALMIMNNGTDRPRGDTLTLRKLLVVVVAVHRVSVRVGVRHAPGGRVTWRGKLAQCRLSMKASGAGRLIAWGRDGRRAGCRVSWSTTLLGPAARPRSCADARHSRGRSTFFRSRAVVSAVACTCMIMTR